MALPERTQQVIQTYAHFIHAVATACLKPELLPQAQQMLGQWLTGISLASLDPSMSSEKDQRLDGIFGLMKVPGFERAPPATADPHSLTPMVVEVDLSTNHL